MKTLNKRQLPADEPTLRAALASYKSALAAHRGTEGQPAPWPDFDVLREIVADPDADFEVVEDPHVAAAEAAEAERIEAERVAAEARAAEAQARAAALENPTPPDPVVEARKAEYAEAVLNDTAFIVAMRHKSLAELDQWWDLNVKGKPAAMEAVLKRLVWLVLHANP